MHLPWVSDPTYRFGGGFELNLSPYNHINYQYNNGIKDVTGDHNSQLFGGNMGNSFTGYGGRDVFYLGTGNAPDLINYVSWRDAPIWSRDEIFNFDPAHDRLNVSGIPDHVVGHMPTVRVQAGWDPYSGTFFHVSVADDPYLQDSDTLHINIHTGHSAEWDYYTKDHTPQEVANLLQATFSSWILY